MSTLAVMFCILLSATIALLGYSMVLQDENVELKKRVKVLENILFIRYRPGGQKHAK